MLTKRKTKELLSQYGLRPRKQLGQNFLVDKNISEKMIGAMDITDKDVILEIGPGLGALTGELARRAGTVCAAELDRGLCKVLDDTLRLHKNLNIMCGDILKTDLTRLAHAAKLKVVGNLPFYITTPVIEHLLKNKTYLRKIWITVQKEVALYAIRHTGFL